MSDLKSRLFQVNGHFSLIEWTLVIEATLKEGIIPHQFNIWLL